MYIFIPATPTSIIIFTTAVTNIFTATVAPAIAAITTEINFTFIASYMTMAIIALTYTVSANNK